MLLFHTLNKANPAPNHTKTMLGNITKVTNDLEKTKQKQKRTCTTMGKEIFYIKLLTQQNKEVILDKAFKKLNQTLTVSNTQC